MKIKVKTNFCGEPEFDVEKPTLRKVLLDLSKREKLSIFTSGNQEVLSDLKVYLNGVDYEALPHGVDAELKNGDNVEVTLVILAGG